MVIGIVLNLYLAAETLTSLSSKFLPSLLFLDSLSMHRKKSIAKSIRGWLNFEWNRLKKKVDGISKLPFTSGMMPLLTPETPWQDNGCDCGVFVCRYAYSLFQMRHQCFSQFDLSDGCDDLFLYKNLFVFDMADIARIREEMVTLIRNLSKVYLRLKKEEKGKKKSKSATAKDDENAVSAIVSAEETKDGHNKSECADESLVSSGDNADMNIEAQINQTPNEESLLVAKEKENVGNSSDTSKKDEEVKRSVEGSGNSNVGSDSETDRSQDLLLDGNDSESC